MSQKATPDCVTMEEFQVLALAVARKEKSKEELMRAQKHLLSCKHCRSIWTVEELLRQLPVDVVRTHLETLNMKTADDPEEDGEV